MSWSRPLPHVLRRLARAPLFTGVSILTLALGIGANAALFSLVNGVLLRPLPFENPERLVGVWHTAPGLGFDMVNQSPALDLVYRDSSEVFEAVGMWRNSARAVTGQDRPERVESLEVTQPTLPLLGVRAALGRVFTAEDDSPGSPRTVLLCHDYWQTRMGGAPDVLGRTLVLDGEPHEVIGVLPESFRFLNESPLLVTPMRIDPAEVRGVGNFSFQGLARLKPGVTLEQANADVARMLPIAIERYPGMISASQLKEARFGPNVGPLLRDAIGNVGDVLWVLLGTVALVLLIACANVANLFLVRADARHREMAIRTALGAGRLRLAREFLEESAVLGLAGALLGLALAEAGLRVLIAFGPQTVPRLHEVSIDATVLGFTFGLSLVAALFLGALPVLRHLRGESTDGLKEGGRGGTEGRVRQRVRGALVVGQVAMALVLLAASGLLLRSFQALSHVDPGFVRPEQVLTFRVAIPDALVPEAVDVPPMWERMIREIESRPGVESVAISSSITMDGSNSNDALEVEDFPTPEGQLPPIRRFKWVGPGYFATMGNPVLAGRDITWTDIYERRPVVVISEPLARAHWESPQAALGRRVRTGIGEGTWREIVGVVGGDRDDGVAEDPVATAYWPLAIDHWWDQEVFVQRYMAFAVRSPRVGSSALMDEMRESVWAVNRDLPVASVRTLEEIHERSLARTSFAMTMLAIAAAMALLLGAVGVYGVISYSVAQRTREIGVRMALGAQRADVSRLVLRQGLVLTAIGVGVGVAAALALGHLMQALLYGVEARDPLTIAAVSLALAVIGVVATSLPAFRAASVDPIEALRWE